MVLVVLKIVQSAGKIEQWKKWISQLSGKCLPIQYGSFSRALVSTKYCGRTKQLVKADDAILGCQFYEIANCLQSCGVIVKAHLKGNKGLDSTAILLNMFFACLCGWL